MTVPLKNQSRIESTNPQDFEESGPTVLTYTHPFENVITDTREQLEIREDAIFHLCPAGISAHAQAFVIDELIELARLTLAGMLHTS